MYLDNYIETLKRELEQSYTDEYVDFYNCFNHSELAIILSTLHSNLISSFNVLNQRLPTKENISHFWADPSRELIDVIETINTLQRKTQKTEYAFKMDDSYQSIINVCNEFLSSSGGSTIPSNMDKIELYYKQPVFIKLDSVHINNRPEITNLDLKLIGEGSYAHVYKFADPFYNKSFVIKRAKNDLNEKELERFMLEFDTMNNLNSPYIVEVFNYNNDKKQYVMEYMDFTLYDYINKRNNELSKSERKVIIAQIIKAFDYISSKNILHRDISPKNVLIKQYEHTNVIKVSDFGLVKTPNNDLTSANTEIKGSFNDPSLRLDGFKNYNILHETYALTLLVFFVMTGKTNINNIKDENLKGFVYKGLDSNLNNRYQSIFELDTAFKKL